MGCPACKTDYVLLEKRINTGEIKAEEQLLFQILGEDLCLTGNGLVIYCPSCKEAVERLKTRIASRLRKDTLANIGDLLDRASNLRNLAQDRKS